MNRFTNNTTISGETKPRSHQHAIHLLNSLLHIIKRVSRREKLTSACKMCIGKIVTKDRSIHHGFDLWAQATFVSERDIFKPKKFDVAQIFFSLLIKSANVAKRL